MSRCSEHHLTLDEHGEGKCSVPMWWGDGTPGGFCDKPAYGKRPPTRTYTRWDGVTLAEDGYHPFPPSGLSCPSHGGPTSRAFGLIEERPNG